MLDTFILGYETPLTIALFILGIIISIWAQATVHGSFKKYKQVRTSRGITGFEVARQILDKNGLQEVHVVETEGMLSDHYDPSRKVVRLSHDIFHGDTIAAASVAAHEVGHAIQDKQGYVFMRIRAMFVPVVNLVNWVGYAAMFISLLAGATGYLVIGIILVLATLLFQLITLPVEFDASKRANEQLIAMRLVDERELPLCKKMLNAAAFTYVAGVIASLLSLLRLIIMLTQNRE